MYLLLKTLLKPITYWLRINEERLVNAPPAGVRSAV